MLCICYFPIKRKKLSRQLDIYTRVKIAKVTLIESDFSTRPNFLSLYFDTITPNVLKF